MSGPTTRTRVDLSPDWIDDLITTAFDRDYGGSWYWIYDTTEISYTDITDQAATLHLETRDDLPWRTEILHTQGHGRWTATLDKDALDYAWARIVNQSLLRDDLTGQFLASMASGDLDIDAHAADCLVQIALFDQVVFS